MPPTPSRLSRSAAHAPRTATETTRKVLLDSPNTTPLPLPPTHSLGGPRAGEVPAVPISLGDEQHLSGGDVREDPRRVGRREPHLDVDGVRDIAQAEVGLGGGLSHQC